MPLHLLQIFSKCDSYFFFLRLADPDRTEPRSSEVQQPDDGAGYTDRLSKSEKATQTNQGAGLGPGQRCKTKTHSTFKKVSLKIPKHSDD